ncbi:MAG: iron-sulfur cluster assembly accessory protein [Telmatospirillum sp.]|nr:iron-sulfur cluster assembly accessory protein [Telmatospirillum sp.]
MIALTESAIDAVRNAIAGAAAPVGGLRILVEAGGCAGFQYRMGLVARPDPDDLVIDQGGVRLFVDGASGALLAGTTIDFVVALEGSGFTFDNPNAKTQCGCGKSFSQGGGSC